MAPRGAGALFLGSVSSPQAGPAGQLRAVRPPDIPEDGQGF